MLWYNLVIISSNMYITMGSLMKSIKKQIFFTLHPLTLFLIYDIIKDGKCENSL